MLSNLLTLCGLGLRSVPAELVEAVVVDAEVMGQLVHDGDQHLVAQVGEIDRVGAQREAVGHCCVG